MRRYAIHCRDIRQSYRSYLYTYILRVCKYVSLERYITIQDMNSSLIGLRKYIKKCFLVRYCTKCWDRNKI